MPLSQLTMQCMGRESRKVLYATGSDGLTGAAENQCTAFIPAMLVSGPRVLFSLKTAVEFIWSEAQNSSQAIVFTADSVQGALELKKMANSKK